MTLNQYIDHTLLKPTATQEDIRTLCNEAMHYDFYAVCVNGCYVEFAKSQLQDSDVKVAAVIGFPLGASSTETKVFEAKDHIDKGASEIDMVINVGWLKAKKYELVENEIRQIKQAIGNNILKVIIEACYLTHNEKQKACELAMKANADFVKTSTGFGTGGATLEDVMRMKEVVGDQVRIKASGGIKDQETAKKYIALGASRIGTSSGINIVSPSKNKNDEHTY